MNPSQRVGRQRLLVRTGVTLVLVSFLVWKVPLGEVVGKLRHMPAWGLVFALVVLLAQTLLGVARWKRMLARTGENVPFRLLWSDVLVSSAYNMILPSSVGGDFIRALRCSRRLTEPHRAWSTTLFERLVGVVSLALVAAPGMLALPVGREFLAPSLALALLGGVVLLVADAPLRFLARLATTRAPTIASLSAGIAHDLQGPLGTGGARLEAFGWSIAYQLCGVSILVACIAPWHNLALTKAIYAGVPLVVVGAMLPVSVAGLGLRESLFVMVLGRFGVDRPTSLALALVWLASYFVLAIAGVIASWLARAPLEPPHNFMNEMAPPTGLPPPAHEPPAPPPAPTL